MTENAGTAPELGEAPEAPEAAPAAAVVQGTPSTADEVTTLRSRNAGLDAKVTTLSQTAAAEKARADAAEARALALANEKENGDQELRAQVKLLEANAAKSQLEAKLARIEAKYPETYGVIGEAAAGLSDDVLAASEARMKGDAQEPETALPVGANPGRAQSAVPKTLEEMTLAELEKHLKGLDPSVVNRSFGGPLNG